MADINLTRTFDDYALDKLVLHLEYDASDSVDCILLDIAQHLAKLAHGDTVKVLRDALNGAKLPAVPTVDIDAKGFAGKA